jgi:hypothetical protein
MSHQNLFHLQPVDDLVDFFQSLETAVIFPPAKLMEKLWHRFGNMSSNIVYLLYFIVKFVMQLFYGSLTRKFRCALLVGNVSTVVIDE